MKQRKKENCIHYCRDTEIKKYHTIVCILLQDICIMYFCCAINYIYIVGILDIKITLKMHTEIQTCWYGAAFADTYFREGFHFVLFVLIFALKVYAADLISQMFLILKLLKIISPVAQSLTKCAVSVQSGSWARGHEYSSSVYVPASFFIFFFFTWQWNMTVTWRAELFSLTFWSNKE